MSHNRFQGDTFETGFSVLPGGGGDNTCDFILSVDGFYGLFWTSTSENASDAYILEFDYNDGVIFLSSPPKTFGCSVRCLKN